MEHRRQFIKEMMAGGVAVPAFPHLLFGTESVDATNPAVKAPDQIKFLFFDFRDYTNMSGFDRVPEQPVKYSGNPLFMQEDPWALGAMSLYGSVIKLPGKPFQLWYSARGLSYAESDDGLKWNKPLFDRLLHDGKPTNIIFTKSLHGPTIMYDEREPRPDWKYKMMAGGGNGPIYAYHSADGINWHDVYPYPVITTGPDCPMSLHRGLDGRYVAYHRVFPLHRRVCRSESWDFRFWSGEPRMVFEPDAGDPPMIDFYGMGVTTYGDFEMGTVWIYHVDPIDPLTHAGYQDAEIAYSRNGYAWHRMAQGTPFIHRGEVDSWEPGHIQMASQPVYLDNEIRYYYAANISGHKMRWIPPEMPRKAGLGCASIKPDRFVGIRTGKQDTGMITTHPFEILTDDIRVNANIGKDGWIRVEILDYHANVLEGYTFDQCVPVSGDSIDHKIRWNSTKRHKWDDGAEFAREKHMLRLRLTAKNATVYSMSTIEKSDTPPVYHKFRSIKGQFYR